MSKHLDVVKWVTVCGILVTLITSVVSQQTTYGGSVSPTRSRIQTRHREKQILDQVLSSNGTYDTNIRPSGGKTNTGETQVTINLMLNSVSKIDDFNMEYKVQLTLRMEWIDDRLRYTHLDRSNSIKYVTISDVKRIWIPDVFFINEKDGHFHNIIKPNVYIRIFPNGFVSISIRMSLTL